MAPHLARRIPGKIAWQQMLILSAINFNEAVQGNVIWAFLPFAVQKWGARPNEVGTYVGLLACSFFAAQFLFVGMWGLAADRFGRRPTLLIGTLGTAISMTLFGFARSIPAALFARFLTGALSANVAIVKTYLGEICDTSTVARGFALLSLTWGAGCIFAPMLGGYLSEPATMFPSVFGGIAFFEEFPYILPSLVAVFAALMAFLVGIVWLPETEVWTLQHERRHEGVAAVAAGAHVQHSAAVGTAAGRSSAVLTSSAAAAAAAVPAPVIDAPVGVGKGSTSDSIAAAAATLRPPPSSHQRTGSAGFASSQRASAGTRGGSGARRNAAALTPGSRDSSLAHSTTAPGTSSKPSGATRQTGALARLLQSLGRGAKWSRSDRFIATSSVSGAYHSAAAASNHAGGSPPSSSRFHRWDGVSDDDAIDAAIDEFGDEFSGGEGEDSDDADLYDAADTAAATAISVAVGEGRRVPSRTSLVSNLPPPLQLATSATSAEKDGNFDRSPTAVIVIGGVAALHSTNSSSSSSNGGGAIRRSGSSSGGRRRANTGGTHFSSLDIAAVDGKLRGLSIVEDGSLLTGTPVPSPLLAPMTGGDEGGAFRDIALQQQQQQPSARHQEGRAASAAAVERHASATGRSVMTPAKSSSYDHDDNGDNGHGEIDEENAPLVSSGSASSSLDTPSAAAATPPAGATFFSLLQDPAIFACVACYSCLAASQVLFDEILPVFCETDVASGGLGLKLDEIGRVQVAQGIAQIAAQLTFVPPLITHFGPLRSFRWSMLPVVLLAFFPAIGRLALRPDLFWPALSLGVALKAIVMSVSFSGIMICINNSSRGANLGLVNGVGQTAASFVRAVGPFLGGPLFSASIGFDAALGAWKLHVVYVVLAAFAVIAFTLSFRLPMWIDSTPTYQDVEVAREHESQKEPPTATATPRELEREGDGIHATI